MSVVSAHETIDAFSTIYPSMLPDVVRIIHQYFVPCPVLWTYVMPVTYSATQLLDSPTSCVEFKEGRLVRFLRTSLLTDCTSTRFMVRFHFSTPDVSAVRFRLSGCGEKKDGTTFSIPLAKYGTKEMALSFSCLRREKSMMVELHRHSCYTSVNGAFAFSDGDQLEISFYYRGMRSAWLNKAEIVEMT